MNFIQTKVVKIQNFYLNSMRNKLFIINKIWNRECALVLKEQQKIKKVQIIEMSTYINKLSEGYVEVSLDDCIRNIKM